MVEYYYPEEVNRETRELRRRISVGPNIVALTSDRPMLFTVEELHEIAEALHRLWRRAWLRQYEKELDDKLAKHPTVARERASWAAWEAHCKAHGLDPLQINRFRKWEDEQRELEGRE